ncbi:hypothetical protein L6164_005885 [Bauhinia variegata]|uniref:Uncharacterized protein n=1 Tax=Bauhinia variegata TaxID=167791 RepID=A0ACB9PSP1_BAUVA|nr:hypothetical protein L6164_005885 [Bauhinia variegata]
MGDHRHHHHQHRPHRLSVPSRSTNPTTFAAANATTPRPYPMYPYSSSTPTPTPSKHRLPSFSSISSKSSGKSSLSFLFLLLFSLRSLYSLLPFLRSSPSFSLFPFSFLVSLLSFLLTLSFSLFSLYTSSSSKDPFHQHKQNQPIFGLNLITLSQQRLLAAKSILLALVFLLRFQALRYCGTAAMILAELTGNVAARFIAERRNQNRNRSPKVWGFLALFSGLFLLSFSWDRVECFPFSSSTVDKWGYAVFPTESCVRIWPMLLPFLSGFLGCYERSAMDWGTIKQLGHKRVRLITLFFTTTVLFVPAVFGFLVFESEEDSVSIGNLAWPLVNTVVFGVLLNENITDEKLLTSKDFQREFLVTFICTVVLELFYFPELSLWGLLLSGLLLYIAVRELDPFQSDYLGDGSSESTTSLVMKPISHILNERKSRKIALFLLINTAYMVVEFVAGFMSNSLGLISDACHMLFDCAALAIGLYASYISRLPANNQYNYGRGRFEVLSGYANAVFLVLVGALIVLESFERILDPQEISTNSILAVSIGGLVVNVIGLIFFHEEHHHAHGGVGSCSHSHSHSHHQHHHGKHDHEEHGRHQEFVSVYSDNHGKSCSGNHAQNHHDHDHCHHHVNNDCHAEGHIVQKDKNSNHNHHHHHHHDHPHDNHDHALQHVKHHHEHHDADHHCHDHDNHDHVHHHHHHHNEISLAHSSDIHVVAGSHGEGVCTTMGNCDSHQSKALPDVKGPREHSHRHVDHNMEGIFLHVLADTMGSVGVVISTLLIKYKGWLVADPACSIFISVMIISTVISLLRNSAEVLLQRVPRVHEQEVKDALKDVLKIKGVYGIQKFHVWSFTNTDVVGTLHLHVSRDTEKASIKSQVLHILNDAGIKDLTLQVESVGS